MMQSGPQRDNSDDLTDEEIAAAVPTGKADDITAKLAEHECGACLATEAKTLRHQLRRRAPHLYWRVHFPCGQQILFQATWLQGHTETTEG